MFSSSSLGLRSRALLISAFLLLLLAFAILPVVGAQDSASPNAPEIIGGQEASPGEWPWQVALVYADWDIYEGQYCGGTLIDEQWVLTAAHCVVDGGLTVDPDAIQVAVGVHDLSSPEAGYQILDLETIIVHPNYDADTYDSDLALLMLATPATLGPTAGGELVATIPLVASSVGDLAGQTATISGWGDMSGDDDYATTLMEGVVPIVTNANCNDANSYNGQITANMLCAGYAAGGVDSCQGDSGGPLVINGPEWQLAGVVSWGVGRALPEKYGVYTRVSRFADWVDASMNPPAAPTITSFAPSSGHVGDSVTITGTDLSTVTAVEFNGVEAAAFSAVSNTEVTAIVPSGATTGPISLTTIGGTADSTTVFTIISPPTISTFNPASGSVGAVVTVTGANLTGATSVRFNGRTASFTVVSDSQLTATVPSGATSGKISVTTPAGTATSAASFAVVLPPTISKFSPSYGSVNTSVSIYGSNLNGATNVSFGGVSATPTYVSSSRIVVRVPAGAVTGKITVVAAGGEATSSGTFTVLLPPPTISGFTPSSGSTDTEVIINGTNFSGVTSVSFNGRSARFSVLSPTQIRTWVPSGAKSGRISVSTSSGKAYSSASFSVQQGPQISKFKPTSGPVGRTVVIYGKYLSGVTSVRFGSVAATITGGSSTKISVIVPAGATTDKIYVATPSGTAESKYAFRITTRRPR